MIRSRGIWQLLVAMTALCAATLCTAQTGSATSFDTSSGISGNRWVTTWSAAQQQPGPMTIDAIFGGDKSRSFENETIRHIVHTSVGGRKVRVRISNAYGFLQLSVGAASVALRSAGAAIYPGTSRRLTLAIAWAGITVLAPSPVKPPRIPWISNVGSAQVRSSTE